MARRLGWAAPRGLAPGALLLMMVASAYAVEPSAPTAIRHRLPAHVLAVIEPAVVAATRRLSEPACSQVLGDFTDREGRSLEERLASLGLEPEAYFRLVVFVDGQNTRLCQRRDVAAFTNPGGRVVAVCPALLRIVRQDRRLAEDVVIHETLHTLGLEENPPSSLEINKRIFERCGR
jgi:hypothetical protein